MRSLENFGGDRPLPQLTEKRGNTNGANCSACPFSFNGAPSRPVVGEGAADPAWILVGEGPGCFPGWTPVLTPKGFIDIEKLKVGDLVTAGNGQSTVIKKTFKKLYEGRLVEVNVVGGLSVWMTANHPVFAYELTKARSGRGRRGITGGAWLPADQLTAQHAVFFPFPQLKRKKTEIDLTAFDKFQPNQIALPNRIPITPDIAFLLGVYMGDGSTGSGVTKLHLSQDYKEKHIPRLVAIARRLGIEPTYKYTGKVITIKLNCSKLARWFKATFGNYAWEKRVPSCISEASLAVKSQFLFGWHETDGKHLKNLNKPRSISTSSLEGAYSAISLFLELKTYPVFRAEAPSLKGKGKRPTYDIGVNNTDIKKLQWPLATHDKKARAIHTIVDTGFIVPIRRVVHEDWTDTVFNIETETHDYTVPFQVHNSNEVIVSRPFVGASGAVVEKALTSIKRPRTEIYIANATLCRPFEGATEAHKDQAARCCAPRLRSELAQFPGKPILSVGGAATRIFLSEVLAPPKKTATKEELAAVEALIPPAQAALQSNLSPRLALAQAQSLGAFAANGDSSTKELWAAAQAEKPKAVKKPRRKPGEPKPVKLKKPKKEKGPKIRRPRGHKKGKGLTFSDIVSTLHTTTFVSANDPRQIIPTIHPAAILRSSGQALKGSHSSDLVYWNFLYDMGKLDALARGVDVVFKEDILTEYQDSARATRLVIDIVHEARTCGEAGIDLETAVDDQQRHHALMMYVAQIKAIGIATPTRSVCVMWDLLGVYGQALIRDLLLDENVSKTFHNGLYDRTVFRARGFESGTAWQDSLLAHHAAFPGMAHKLQLVAGQFFAIRPWKSEFRDAEETPKELTTYCALDTLSCTRLIAPLQIMIKKTATEKVYELDRTMSDIASNMHLWGVPINREINQELLSGFRVNIDKAKEEIEQLANDPETLERIKHYACIEESHTIRKGDPEDFRERHKKRVDTLNEKIAAGKWKWGIDKSTHIVGLLRALGVNLYKTTPSGRTATGKEILESLVDVPIVRRIVTYRENAKLLSTFVWSLFDRYLADGSTSYGYADEHDRVHPSWSITKISGRWASTEPVLSNVPKDDAKKGRPNLRKQVVAPEGRIFVGFDFKALEARVIALISGDPWLSTHLDPDLHTDAMKVVWGEKAVLALKANDPKRFKVLRDAVKRFEYGAFYGGSVETLWKTLLKDDQNAKLADVAAAVRLLMNAMPGVVLWQDDCVKRATTGLCEIRSHVMKRRRAFPLMADRNESINYGPQSSASDIMNFGFKRMWERLGFHQNRNPKKYKGTCFPILQIHDAAVFECNEDDADKVKQDVVECFTQEYTSNGNRIAFPVECDIAKSWADV